MLQVEGYRILIHNGGSRILSSWIIVSPSQPDHPNVDRLVGLVVKVSTSGAEDLISNPTCEEIFPGSIGTPVATLPDAWHCRVSTGTGQPGFSILCLGEVESLVCNFYLSLAARKIVCADPSLRYTSMLLGC